MYGWMYSISDSGKRSSSSRMSGESTADDDGAGVPGDAEEQRRGLGARSRLGVCITRCMYAVRSDLVLKVVVE
jgi:hypothetical protein